MDTAVHILLKAKGYSVSNHLPFHPKMRTYNNITQHNITLLTRLSKGEMPICRYIFISRKHSVMYNVFIRDIQRQLSSFFGYFNHISNYSMYRGNNTLNHCYSSYRNVYKPHLHPPLGKSGHASILLYSNLRNRG